MNTLINGMTRSLMLRLPKSLLVWLVHQALIVSREPVVANIDVRSFEGYGIGAKKINMINCVRCSSETECDPARNDSAYRDRSGRTSLFSQIDHTVFDKSLIQQNR
jgi:hypothetical protein